jgi:hypothetical protein
MTISIRYTIVPILRGPNTTEYDIIKEFAQRNDVDLLLPQTLVTQMRYMIVDYSVCTDTMPTALLLPATKIESFIWAPVQPFTATVGKLWDFLFKNFKEIRLGLDSAFRFWHFDRWNACTFS